MLKCFFSFCVLLCFFSSGWVASSVFGQQSCTGFNILKPTFFPLSGYNASAIKTFDVNNDGIPDLLVTLPQDGKLAVQLGNGQGEVSGTAYFAAGANPTDLDLGDFNRDGEIDVVVANASSNQFSLLLGDGTGNFSLQASFASDTSPQVLKVGYFDNDNYLDVAVANSGTLKIYKGNRNLTFSLITNITTVGSPKKIISSDFNLDGKVDLALSFVQIGASQVRVYSGQGDGNFTLIKTFPGIEVFALSAADVDNNGTPDLIANDYPTGRFLVYKGLGGGIFQEPVISNVGSVFGSETVDFDGDGKLDLVSGTGSVFLGDGSSNFSFAGNAGTESSAASVGVADFNSDNLPDFAVLSSNGNLNNGTSIIINKGAGGIGGSPLFYLNRPYEIESADFNLDGRYDLVAVNGYNHTAHVYLQNEQGGFVPTSPLIVGSGPNDNPFAVATADFNDDDKPDFAVPDASSGRVVVFTGNGDGTFIRTTFNLAASNVRPSNVRTGDFNNDGKTDIITMNSSSRDYSVLLNNGTDGFNFLPGVNVNSDSTNNIVAIGDITNDGKLDLVVGRPSQGALIYLVGGGDGTFVRMPFPINGLGNITSIILEDFNNDANLDLAIGGTDRMIVSFGVGNGGFFNPVHYPIAGSINDLEYQDFDLDGIKDIVAAGGPPNSIIFFKGVGSGVFNQGVPVSVNISASSITARDFNNDGKLDFGFSSAFGGRISVVYNDSNALPCLSVNDAQITEGNTGTVNISFEAALTAVSSQSISVDYKTVGRTAASGVDFVQSSGTLVFPPGTTTQTVNLTINGDVLDEDDETFTLTLTNSPNARIADAVGTAKIIDDDAQPNLTTGSGSVVEGDTGTTIVSMPVNLSGASGRKIKAQVTTQDLTATSNQDYQPISEKVFFNPGEVTKNILVAVNSDYRVEPDETFNINLTAPVNVNLANNQATGTILNDDVGGVIQFSAPSISVSENNVTAQIIVSRAGGIASDVIVGYSTINGTALAGSDYQPVAGNLIFGANETSKTISVPIINDALNEDTETFSLSLENVSGGGTLGGQTNITVNLQDNDPLPGLSVANYSVAEGNDGLKTINVSLTLLAASGRTVSVNYAAQNGTATAPSDYLPATGSISFTAGETSKTIQLSIVGDTIFELDETFSLVLSNPVNGVIAGGTASVTILNDDLSSNSARADFDGDGKSDVSVFRPEDGTWYLLQSVSGFTGVQFGISTDKLVPADYDGDGKTDVAVYRSGTWYLQRSQLGFTGVAFGAADDVPVPADYDGDGKADVAVFRPSNGTWYLLQSTAGFTGITFGQLGDKPVAADYDGDGKTDVAVFRAGIWYIQRTQLGFTGIAFGEATDKPVPADYDGDGKTDVAVFRSGTWYLQRSQSGFTAFAFGAADDIPVPADYDGDGKADVAVFRLGTWYLQRSTQGFTGVAFGATTDKPVPNAFVF